MLHYHGKRNLIFLMDIILHNILKFYLWNKYFIAISRDCTSNDFRKLSLTIFEERH